MSNINWQDLLTVLTQKGTDTGVLSRVKKLHDNVLRFEICYTENKPFLEEWLKTKIKIDAKSSSKSLELRETGNKIYQKGNDVEALKFYNLSTATAPYGTIEFALAVSNRSAVLARLNHFKDAIQDIDLALQHESDDIPKTKLLIRKAILLHKLQLYSDALLIIKSIFPIEDEIRNHTNIDLKNVYFDAVEQIKACGTESSAVESTQSLPVPKGGINEHLSSSSAHVSLKFSEKKGRYLIADEDFEKSDIIFVETPFALVVLPEQYQQHCHHCCKRVFAFIPCRVCTKALFCSNQCCETAWSQYHQWECGSLDVYHCIGVAHLGLRIALKADTSDRYQQVYDLVTHLDDMNAEDIYQYANTAVLLTLYLEQYTSYFTSNPSVKVKEMGPRILHHIAQIVCNGHAITKIDSITTEQTTSKTVTEEQLRIATAIYPSASMMNHSCDQNVVNSFINDCLVVTASRPIKKGEEVFNCYGPNHKTMTKEERQQVLKSQYFFSCDCLRCSQPTKSEYQQFSAMLCQFCFGPVLPDHASCADCSRAQPLSQLMDMALLAQQAFHKGSQFFKEGDMNKALIFFEESVKLSSKCLYRQNSDLRQYKDFLARTYVELGRSHEAIPIIEECIESIEIQFGKDCSEFKNEVSKLFDVMLADMERLRMEGKLMTPEFGLTNQKFRSWLNKLTNMKGEDIVADLLKN